MNDRQTELLSRFIDGELSPSERAQVQSLLAASAQARARLERMRQVDHTLREAFSGSLDEDVPERLLQTLGGHASTGPASANRRPRRAANQAIFALAASLVLAVGVSLMQLFPAPDTLDPADHRLLQTALDQAASHERISMPNGAGSVQLIGTYLTGTRQTCREFELQRTNDLVIGLACLRPDAGWHIEGMTHIAGHQQNDASYQPAAGDQDPVAEALDRLGAGAPLEAAAEAELRFNGWRTAEQ